PMLNTLGLIESAPRSRLRSRVLSTHMVGVKPFEDCVRLADYKTATPFSRGTTHHLFDGGWIQVVDFGNHEGSSNTLCGVTVGLVHALAAALLKVVAGEAVAEKEFARVAGFQDALIDFNDQMLAAARTAAKDFRLWNAYSRVWLLWQILAHLSLKRATLEAAA